MVVLARAVGWVVALCVVAMVAMVAGPAAVGLAVLGSEDGALTADQEVAGPAAMVGWVVVGWVGEVRMEVARAGVGSAVAGSGAAVRVGAGWEEEERAGPG